MAFVPKILKNVTVPLLKLKKGQPYYVRFVSELYKGKEIPGPAGADGTPVQKNAPMMARVNNLEDETGEVYEIIVPTVAYKELSENYASGVQGKCFALTISSAGDGKRYSLATIAEIEDPNPAPAAAETSGEAAANGGKKAK